MKYKYLTKEQILLSLDRLTRFKNTKEKYLRVFSDILISCVLDSKIRKNDIEKTDFTELTGIAETIINESLANLFTENTYLNDNSINIYIKNYENTVFINDSDTQKLLNNNINYNLAAELINTDCPINLIWLKNVVQNGFSDTVNLRIEKALKYPLDKIVLVEGITEEILLPAFARFCGYDFYKEGVQIIPAGGKNQVVKMYYRLIEEVKLPVFILLDKDAEENIKQITPKLRSIDKIHLVSCGEFEDLLPKRLIIKTVNSDFKNFLAISEADLPANIPTAKVLDELFKTKGLHEFKKAEFAKLVRENIKSIEDVSDEVKSIINELHG